MPSFSAVFCLIVVSKVRNDTAEYLYLALQSRDVGRDTDVVEDVLLETEWSDFPYDVLCEILLILRLGLTRISR